MSHFDRCCLCPTCACPLSCVSIHLISFAKFFKWLTSSNEVAVESVVITLASFFVLCLACKHKFCGAVLQFIMQHTVAQFSMAPRDCLEISVLDSSLQCQLRILMPFVGLIPQRLLKPVRGDFLFKPAVSGFLYPSPQSVAFEPPHPLVLAPDTTKSTKSRCLQVHPIASIALFVRCGSFHFFYSVCLLFSPKTILLYLSP
jgi:hypothetical protein